MTQPEALRLADLIRSRHGNEVNDEAAAELRRLHEENERIGPLAERVLELKAQRDALLEALRAIIHAAMVHACHHALSVDGQQFYDIARAAIKAVEGEKT